jgi:hypothetical protein
VWERGRGSWRLASHEDVGPDGSTRTLTVDRTQSRVGAGEAAIPRVHCADARAHVVAAAPAEPPPLVLGASGLATLGPVGLARLDLGARFAGEDCTSAGADAEGACVVQMVAVIGASAALVGAAASVWAGCVVPNPVVIATCISATAAFTSASTALAVTSNAYQDCRDKALAPKPCSCPAAPTDVRVDGTAGAAAAPLALDCAEPSAPSGGSGGGGGEPAGGTGNGYWAEFCEYIDHYDQYGNYLYTSDLTCRIVWIE